MALTGRQFPIGAGEFHAVVVEVGGALRSLSHGDAQLTCSYADDELPPKAVGAVLVPWPNRIADGAYEFDGDQLQLPLTDPSTSTSIHGLGRWVRWKPLEHTLSSVTLALDIVPQKGWPFEVRAEVTYSLDAATGLTVSATARNVGSRRAPFGAGFHPYVSTRGAALSDVTVELPAATHLSADDRGIPTGRHAVDGTDLDLRGGRRLGELRLDDAFTDLARVDGLVRAKVSGPAFGAEIWFDEAFGYSQVFTLDDLGNGQAGVAVEPMTCPADAFRSGEAVTVLEPGDSWRGSWGIRPL